MHNWSIDLSKFKGYPREAAIWKLEQLVNFGLNGEKINRRLLKKYWKLLHLDPTRKKFLHFLLWPKKS